MSEYLDRVIKLARKGTVKRPELTGRFERAVLTVLFRRMDQREDGTWMVESSDRAGRFYEVNGRCTCPDANGGERAAAGGWCKHRLAVALHERATADIRARVVQRAAAADAMALARVAEARTAQHYLRATGRPCGDCGSQDVASDGLCNTCWDRVERERAAAR